MRKSSLLALTVSIFVFLLPFFKPQRASADPACDQVGEPCCSGGGACGTVGTCCTLSTGTQCGGSYCISSICGNENQGCCSGPSSSCTCNQIYLQPDAGKICRRNCGGLNQPCCPGPMGGQTCNSPYLCSGSFCRSNTCGSVGQACCTTGPACNESWVACRPNTSGGGTSCQAACDSAGATCCPSGYAYRCNGTNLVCNGTTCAYGGGGANGGQPINTSCPGVNGPENGGVLTAIGCIPLENPQAFTRFLLRWGLGIAGGIAFILMVYGGFMVITSGGNPQKLQAGKELVTSAAMGLVLLLFGVFLLRLIGVDILGIPHFGQ